MKMENKYCENCFNDDLDKYITDKFGGIYCDNECMEQSWIDKNKELEVISVRYYETRRGLGYECKTNYKGISIWNDGHGGQTYLNFDLRDKSFNPKDYEEMTEGSLEELINDYEYKKQ